MIKKMVDVNIYEVFSKVYDSVMSDKFYEDYYKFISTIIKKHGIDPKNILELASGTGKLAKNFLNKGYDVECLDISPSMLQIAQQKGLKTYEAKMTNFNLKKRYDLILCVYDSLNYLLQEKDLQQCFYSVHKHLNENGLFIFDMNSDYKINELIPKNPVKTEYRKIGDIEFIWVNSSEPNLWISDLIFFEKENDLSYRRYHEKHVERAYKLRTVKNLLRKTKLQLIDSYSNFQFEKIKKDSFRWFMICSAST
jgi:SAM-dependent methyltransferase